MSEKNNLANNSIAKLDDELLDAVSGGLSVKKDEKGYTVYDKDGNMLAFFSDLQELESFTGELVSVVGKRCIHGLSYYIS